MKNINDNFELKHGYSLTGRSIEHNKKGSMGASIAITDEKRKIYHFQHPSYTDFDIPSRTVADIKATLAAIGWTYYMDKLK